MEHVQQVSGNLFQVVNKVYPHMVYVWWVQQNISQIHQNLLALKALPIHAVKLRTIHWSSGVCVDAASHKAVFTHLQESAEFPHRLRESLAHVVPSWHVLKAEGDATGSAPPAAPMLTADKIIKRQTINVGDVVPKQ